MNKYDELIYSLIYNCNREVTTEEKKILNQASAIYNTYNQLTKQLGCPLDVIEKALTNGIYINGQEGLCIVHRYRKMLTVNQYLSVWIKDYKKTWFLKADKSE